jgi:hypothetical protein
MLVVKLILIEKNRSLKSTQPVLLQSSEDEFELPSAKYANCKQTRRSVSSFSVFFEGTPVSVRSGMQRIMLLSTTEAETIAAVQCAQEMLYISRLVTSLGLKIKPLMILEIDNKGAIDLVNSWSISGRTKHMEVHYQFLQELKEKGILKVEWIPRS